MRNSHKIYTVLDTNIILLDHNNLLHFAKDYEVFIPSVVLTELDKKKSEFSEIGYQARAFHRLIGKASVVDMKAINNLLVTIMDVDGYLIHFTRLTETNTSLSNDDIIVETARILSIDHITQLITNDINCRLKAINVGVPAKDFKETENCTYEFTKHLVVPSDVYSNLHRAKIKDIDPDYSPQNYNYIFQDETTKQTKLGVIRYYQSIEIIGKTAETELRKQDINPIGTEQLFFSYAIQDPSVDIVISDSQAGTGKSLLALSNAIKLLKSNKNYERIIYVRASVDDADKAEELGFRPRSNEKTDIFFHPLYDVLDTIMRQRYKKKKGDKSYDETIQQKVQEALVRYQIQMMTTLGMRGRTFTDSIIIIDECLHKDQKIITDHGTITAEELELLLIAGAPVQALSVNLKTQEVEFKPILSLKAENIEATKEEMYEIEMEDGSTLKVTGNHKVYFQNKYVTINEIKTKLDNGEEIDLPVYELSTGNSI